MDRLRKEDGRHPFVLTTPQIAELHRRTSICDHPLARLMTVATLVPCSAAALALAGVRQFDRGNRLLTVRSPSPGRTRVALGQAAASAMNAAIAGRTSGLLFGGPYDAPIVPDADAVAYLEELITEGDEGPLPFKFTFRSVREGVFAGMSEDHQVLPDIIEAQAGLRRLTDGHFSETFMRIHERAASDAWAERLRAPSPVTIDNTKPRSPFKRWRFVDGSDSGTGRGA